jgi:Tol biopolymer transport system component
MRQAILSIIFLITSCAPVATPLPDLPDRDRAQPALVTIRLSDNTLILRTDPESQTVTEIPLTIDCPPQTLAPAPRGSWLAIEFACGNGLMTVALDTQTKQVRLLTDDPTLDSHFLAWSADGRYVYLKVGMLSDPKIVRVDVTNSQSADLPVSPFTYDLTSSPDNRMIAYSLTRGIGYGSETYTANLKGDNAEKIISGESLITLMRFSPDGMQIAYVLMPDSQTPFPVGGLWLMNADGSNARLLSLADAGQGYAPAWSPDGKWIAFVRREQAADSQGNIISEMAVYDPSRGAAQTITSFGDARVEAPGWSPDGSLLIFNVIRDDTIQLWAYDFSGGKLIVIDTEPACCAAWLAGK